MESFLQNQTFFVRKKCKGYTYIREEDYGEIVPGGEIRYFSKTNPPVFKMGGKITRKTPLYIEFKRKSQTYTIYIGKYHVFYKAPTVKRSKQYRLFRKLLETME